MATTNEEAVRVLLEAAADVVKRSEVEERKWADGPRAALHQMGLDEARRIGAEYAVEHGHAHAAGVVKSYEAGMHTTIPELTNHPPQRAAAMAETHRLFLQLAKKVGEPGLEDEAQLEVVLGALVVELGHLFGARELAYGISRGLRHFGAERYGDAFEARTSEREWSVQLGPEELEPIAEMMVKAGGTHGAVYAVIGAAVTR